MSTTSRLRRVTCFVSRTLRELSDSTLPSIHEIVVLIMSIVLVTKVMEVDIDFVVS